MNAVKGPTLPTSKIGRMGTRKIRGKIERPLRVGHPPILTTQRFNS
jgi:hypothetical protein